MLRAYQWMGGLQVVQLSAGEDVAQAVNRYRASGLVEFAEPDYKLRSFATPNDPEFKSGAQWGLFNSGQSGGRLGSDIQAVAGWDTMNSASNIVVAVVDSGIRYTHEDLAANMWVNTNEIPNNNIDDDNNGYIDDIHGIDAIENTGDPMDDLGHGTHVAGIVGAVGNNGIGVAGVAWNVKLMGCRFLSKAGDGDTSDAIQCIDYARRMGARVINASWGGPDYSAALFTAINTARNVGIVVVAASGNDIQNIDEIPLYPASFTLDNIIVVAGTTRSDTMDTSYSNWGQNTVDLFAPGTGIRSTWHTWDGAYTANTGTSMAAPHVAGIAALMRARFPNYTPQQIVNRLRDTVDVIPALEGKCRTGGRVNMARALGPNPAADFEPSRLTGEPPLSVAFTNTSFGEIASFRWTFGDGSPPATNQNPTHVFEYAGWFRVQLEITGSNGKTHTAERMIKVAPNYEAVTNEYAWVDPAGMAAVVLPDNGFSTTTLPFPFRFYGEMYDTIYIGSNGMLSFSTNGMTTTDNTSLPNAGAPNALICPYWDNLNPAAGGNIHAGVVGEAPNRRFVVSWVNIQRNSSAVNLTFQAILEENGHSILFQYANVSPEAARGGGKRATVGVENSDGSVALQYTYNGAPVVLQNETAVRLTEKPYRYLCVTAPETLAFTGVKDHGFANTNAAIHLVNPGNRSLDWRIDGAPEWLNLSTSGGVLSPGAELAVEATLSAEAYALNPATLTANLAISNLSDGRGSRVVPLQLEILPPVLAFTVEIGPTNTFAGGLGGPFAPEILSLVVRNVGNIPGTWAASTEAPWLELFGTPEELAPGASNSIDLLLLSDIAGQFESGRHSATIRVTSPDAEQVAEAPIYLQVNARIVQQSAQVANGTFKGAFTIPPAGLFRIESSEDLVTWQQAGASMRVTGSSVGFEEPVGQTGHRFYRLVPEE